MRVIKALLITAGIFLVELLATFLTNIVLIFITKPASKAEFVPTGKITAWVFTILMIGGTALWASRDSVRIGLKKYKTGISYGPVVLFIGLCGLWIIGFPWYLVVRDRIKKGEAAPKP